MPNDQTVKPYIYNVQAGLPFVDTLAKGLIRRIEKTDIQLTDYTILLPTRRAVENLREAFLRSSPEKPLLLPKLIPLGDIDEDEQIISGWEDGSFWNDSDVKPAIADLERQLFLTKLVNSFVNGSLSIDQSIALAKELGRLLDQIQTHRLSLDRLAKIVPEDYAEHWQMTLKFLQILTTEWPILLNNCGCLDPAERRNKVLERQAKIWGKTPPKGYIIAAGSTGSIPATADLLNVVSRLPNGFVVLPGLDLSLADSDLPQIEPTHPQYSMAQLMLKMGVCIDDVMTWEKLKSTDKQQSKANLINVALRPASLINNWHQFTPPRNKTFEEIEYVECSGLEEESGVIALMMRKNMEKNDKKTALITPDRELARRVKSQLHRWNIEINDSAGQPLTAVPTGIFINLTAELVLGQFKPVDLLAVCKHPISAFGFSPENLRLLIQKLEVKILRGARPIAGIDGLLRIVKDEHIEFREFLKRLKSASKVFSELIGRKNVSLRSILEAHISFSENIAASNIESGTDRLWAGTTGEAAANFISEFLKYSDVINDIPGRNYPTLLKTLMQSRRVHPPNHSQSNLHIWGLLEARLQHADFLILGGLNEGTWPPEIPADPWMSRPMRKSFGLPLPEFRIGLSAHDFTQAFCAPKIALTRSRRVAGIPTVKARWLSRLTQLLEGHNLLGSLGSEIPWSHLQKLLDKPNNTESIAPPAPRPPVTSRPRKLSVTQVETWMRDPYSIYAKHILKLEPMPPLDLTPDASDYGTLIHSILNQFTNHFPINENDTLPEHALQFLVDLGRNKFKSIKNFPSVWVFWWPRFLSISEWFIEQECNSRRNLIDIKTEAKGEIRIEGLQGEFTLVAVADRIDLFRSDKSVRIIDYKTGTLPTQKEIKAGYSPQLPLEAAIAMRGGFKEILQSNKKVSQINYWRLKGGNPAGEITDLGGNPKTFATDALDGLKRLVRAFDREDTPYEASPRSEYAPKYSDYEHLARVKEWVVTETSRENDK